MDKKVYSAPETEIVELEAADVIRTSINNVSYSGGGNSWGNWFGGGNRGNGGSNSNSNSNNSGSTGTNGPGSGSGGDGIMLINDL